MQPMGLKQGNCKPFGLLLLLCNRLKLHGLDPIWGHNIIDGLKITHLNVSLEPNSAL